MACRIGITIDPERRKQYWQSYHPTLRNWQILEQHTTKSAAQAAETNLAQMYRAVAHAGGRGPEHATWYVYGFEY